MSDPKANELFEMHKRKIAMLGKEGLINTVDQEFINSSSVNPVKTFADSCPVCNKPFMSGYAVRCSDPNCVSIFHADCFGTHTLRVHQPASITVVVKESDTGTIKYVDVVKRVIYPKTVDVPKKTETIVPPKPVSGVSESTVTVPSPDVKPVVQAPVIVPVSEVTEDTRNARQLRADRMKKRSQGRDTRDA